MCLSEEESCPFHSEWSETEIEWTKNHFEWTKTLIELS